MARERQITMELFDHFEEQKTDEELNGIIARIPRAAQITILQVIFEAKYANGRTTERADRFIAALESLIYFPEEKGDYSVVLIGEGEYNSCYRARENVWVNCSLQRPRRAVAKEAEGDSQESNNSLPEISVPMTPLIQSNYRGIVDGDKFCIQDLTKAVGQKDKRRIYTGSQCEMAGWAKKSLIDICTTMKVPGPSENEDAADFWARQTKKQICGSIKEFFRQNRLLVSGTCGTARKKKT